MKIDDVIEGKVKIGNTVYNMVEAKINGTVVWPLNYTYVIVSGSVLVSYSEGSYIYASGSNFALVTADINVYVNNVYVRTITGATLSPSFQSGSAFHAEGNQIHGSDLETTPTSTHPETVTVSYGSASTTVTITQEANLKLIDGYTPTGSKRYDYTQTTTEYSNYNVSLSSDKYDSSGSAAPASGANTTDLRATLSCYATHDEQDTTPYTQDASRQYHYTSHPTTYYYETVSNYYSGRDVTRTAIGVSDTATITGSATGFTRDGMYVTIASEGTDPYPNGRSCTYTATVNKQGGGTATGTVTLYQALNEIENIASDTQRTYGSNYTTQSNDNYTAYISALQYTSSSSPAPAGGGTATLVISASHDHTETVKRDWTDTTYYTYTWSSGALSYDDEVTGTGTETVSSTTTTVPDSVTPTSSQTWATVSGSTLTIASRGTQYGASYRYTTISIANGTASDSVTVYQAKNTYTSSTLYDLSISIDAYGTIVGAGGSFNVAARSYRVSRRTYESYPLDPAGIVDTSSEYTATLTKTNCTSSTNSVRGTSTFTITVAPNPSATDPRNIVLTLAAGGESVSDMKVQSPASIGTANIATLLPFIAKSTAGGRVKGKVYYTLTIESGSVTSSLISVNFKYQLNGGSTQTVNVGTYTVSQTSSPVAFEPSGATIPNFANASTVKAWFQVQSTGSFDFIQADESTYYTYVEFDPYIPPTPDPTN